MTETLKSDGEVTLLKVRLAFPDLYVPTAMEEGKPKQYGATFIMAQDGKMHKRVQAAVDKIAEAKWGKKAKDVLDLIDEDTQKFCFISGDHKKKRNLDGFEGNMALSAKNKLRPPTLNARGEPTDPDDGVVFAGCYVNAKVELWAQDNKHGKAIRASLLGVVFHSKGDAFGGGRVASADDLADLAVGDDEYGEDLL